MNLFGGNGKGKCQFLIEIVRFRKPTHPIHTQRFRLPTANQVLVVTFHEWKIDGKICDVDNILEESGIVI